MMQKSWIHRLMFDAYFEDALMRYRAKTGFGSTYALFNLLNESLHQQGFMDENGYIYHKEKYGRPLVDEFEKHLEFSDQKTRLDLINKENEINLLSKRLENALLQWDSMKENSQSYYLRLARENRNLAVAQRILEKNGSVKLNV